MVRKGYDEGRYEEAYARGNASLDPFERCLCDELAARVGGQGKLLDLGCGVGLPYDRYFSEKGFSVTGVDISAKHVERARRNVPSGTFLVGDFFSEDVKGRFDAVVSFYAIFHIPREEHERLLEHVASLLREGGHILLTLGADDMACEVSEDFAGAPMAWSSYDAEKNKALVEEAGFDPLLVAEDYREERHLWVLARKR